MEFEMYQLVVDILTMLEAIILFGFLMFVTRLQLKSFIKLYLLIVIISVIFQLTVNIFLGFYQLAVNIFFVFYQLVVNIFYLCLLLFFTFFALWIMDCLFFGRQNTDSQLLRQSYIQEATLHGERTNQGESSNDRRSRQELVDRFMMSRMSRLKIKTAQMHTYSVPPSYPPSIAPLQDLSPLSIQDLKPETHHRGSYILLRVITPPYRMIAIMAIAEDQRQDAVALQLYHQENKATKPTTKILKEKDVVLIKEPYFKITSDGEYRIRVDHVSDIIWIGTGDSRIPLEWRGSDKSAKYWKKRGNEAMSKREYCMAIQRYTSALQYRHSVQEESTIRVKRAEAYLKTHSFDAALADTNCLVRPLTAPETALYCAARALYELGRFQECRDILMTLRERFPDNSFAADSLNKTNLRVQEQQTGMFDFKAIYDELSHKTHPDLDHATFVGPVVVKASAGRGRGLFTTKDVQAGDLLLCEKAFAYCYANERQPEKGSNISLILDLETNRMVLGTSGELTSTIVQKIARNPSLQADLTALHHGSYNPVNVAEVDGRRIIDTFLISHIISQNTSGCPKTSLEHCTVPSEAIETYSDCTGIWIKASYINHSCFGNAHRSYIGDLQLIHATQDIPANTELFLNYMGTYTSSYQATQEELKHWGFICDCAICLDRKAITANMLQKRNSLAIDFTVTITINTVIDTAKVERLLAMIEKTYEAPASTVPRILLWETHLLLTRIYARQDRVDKVVELALSGLESLGYIIQGGRLPNPTSLKVVKWGLMEYGVIEAFVHLLTAYEIVASQLCEGAKKYAKTAYRICIGEDATFEEFCGEISRRRWE